MIDDDVLARVGWSRIAEPSDGYAHWLVDTLGAAEALAWAKTAAGSESNARQAVIRDVFARVESDDALLGGPPSARLMAGLTDAVEAWGRRLPVDPDRDVRSITRLGGTVLTPADERWPTGLADLGGGAPMCLWVRGELNSWSGADVGGFLDPAVALVGSRAATSYGIHVATDFAAGLADRGFTVSSGGAFGIDIAAHRAVVACGGRTVVFLAGGLDRPYPLGNADVLAAVLDAGGLWVGENPPGTTPSRHRFLQRNRLIAASARAVVVVEAAWRSGALNTATHATELLRPLGAVPGPVTSVASAGCHRLLRDGAAVCVTDAAEAAELAGPINGLPGALPPPADASRAPDLDPTGLRVWDALGDRSRRTAERIAHDAGLAIGPTLAVLGRFEATGLATVSDGRWLRRRPA